MGYFEWEKRMGIHYAYHQSKINNLIHALMIPMELWAILQILRCIPIPIISDAALLAICASGPVYVATEPLCGATMIVLLLSLRWAALCWLPCSAISGGMIGLGLFAVPFIVQVK